MAANNLKFQFRVDFIQPNYDAQCEQRAGDLNWRPPTIPEAITTIGSTGWYRWTPDGISNTTSIGGEDFRVCSLFFNSESNQFLGVPFDCRTTSIRDVVGANGERFGWRRVMFQHTDPDPDAAPLSIMDFDTEHHVLASTGSRTWMPELIPESYDQNQPDEYVNAPTALAGNLALFIAFAAFSCDRPDVIAVIRHCFKPPHWRPHGLPSGRIHGRGLVVSIKIDPTEPIVTKEVLLRFQQSVFGPIIEP